MRVCVCVYIGAQKTVNYLQFELPYPPSVNTYYRAHGGRLIVSAKGRTYRQRVSRQLDGLIEEPLACRLAVSLVCCMPDNRRRDLDNICKALLDSLQHAGVYLDDSQIDRLSLVRGEVRKPGKVFVTVETV